MEIEVGEYVRTKKGDKRKIKQYTRAEIREITLKRWKERHKNDNM